MGIGWGGETPEKLIEVGRLEVKLLTYGRNNCVEKSHRRERVRRESQNKEEQSAPTGRTTLLQKIPPNQHIM